MPFLIKTKGGPLDGQTRTCSRLEDYGLSWPLPDELPGVAGLCLCCGHPAHGEAPCDVEVRDYGQIDCECSGHQAGRYVKVSESDLPVEAADHPTIGVGVVFEWREAA